MRKHRNQDHTGWEQKLRASMPEARALQDLKETPVLTMRTEHSQRGCVCAGDLFAAEQVWAQYGWQPNDRESITRNSWHENAGPTLLMQPHLASDCASVNSIASKAVPASFFCSFHQPSGTADASPVSECSLTQCPSGVWNWFKHSGQQLQQLWRQNIGDGLRAVYTSHSHSR